MEWKNGWNGMDENGMKWRTMEWNGTNGISNELNIHGISEEWMNERNGD